MTVPHRPSRSCRTKIERQSPPHAASVSESLFTMETSVSLLSLLAARVPDRQGPAGTSWRTDPGPEDLANYRLERASASSTRRTIVPLTKATRFTDGSAEAAARCPLFAVNGLGEESMLGEASLRPASARSAWPLPYRTGTLTISFASHGGLGGGGGLAEVSLFNARGRLVRTIARGSYGAGCQSAAWDGRDGAGRSVPSGIHFLEARSAGRAERSKIVVMR